MADLTVNSPAKVNLMLNILGKTPDGFHELESLIWPIDLSDTLTYSLDSADQNPGIQIECDHSGIPVDQRNLVYKAAERYFKALGSDQARPLRVTIHKRIPAEAGLGGGSSNAAVTLTALNRLFGFAVAPENLYQIAAELGSDVPFFLDPVPSLAVGRGEKLNRLGRLTALSEKYALLLQPGFGVSTAWAYGRMQHFPEALNGRRGLAEELIRHLDLGDQNAFFQGCCNALEAPVFNKFPFLKMARDFMDQKGALLSRMTGSGSTVFSVWNTKKEAETALESFESAYGGMSRIIIAQFRAPTQSV